MNTLSRTSSGFFYDRTGLDMHDAGPYISGKAKPQMNGIDIIILIVLGIFIVKGLFRGLIIEAMTLLGLLFGYIIALRQMGQMAAWIERILPLSSLFSGMLGFLVVFIIVVVAFRLIAEILQRIVKWSAIKWLDRLAGVLFGLIKGALIVSLLAHLVSIVPLSRPMREEQERSFLFEPMKAVAPAVFNFLKWSLPKTGDFYDEIKEGIPQKSDDAMDIISEQSYSLGNEVKEKDE